MSYDLGKYPLGACLSTPLKTMESPPNVTTDNIATALLKIAQRADELAAADPNRTYLNLRCWLQAEQEVLGEAGMLPLGRSQLASRHEVQASVSDVLTANDYVRA
jgi:hypothetical protein